MRNDSEKTPGNRAALSQISRRVGTEQRAGASLSGGERDHLFLSDRGDDENVDDQQDQESA